MRATFHSKFSDRAIIKLKITKLNVNYLPGKEVMFSVAFVCLLGCRPVCLYLFITNIYITQRVTDELRGHFMGGSRW